MFEGRDRSKKPENTLFLFLAFLEAQHSYRFFDKKEKFFLAKVTLLHGKVEQKVLKMLNLNRKWHFRTEKRGKKRQKQPFLSQKIHNFGNDFIKILVGFRRSDTFARQNRAKKHFRTAEWSKKTLSHGRMEQKSRSNVS